jgi:hypothetical protein
VEERKFLDEVYNLEKKRNSSRRRRVNMMERRKE